MPNNISESAILTIKEDAEYLTARQFPRNEHYAVLLCSYMRRTTSEYALRLPRHVLRMTHTMKRYSV